jgi:hypothetical protein
LTLQTELTFDDAKEIVALNLSSLAKFAESLYDQFLQKEFEEWDIALRIIEQKVRQAKNRCIYASEIEQIDYFGRILVRLDPEIEPQLSQFWNFHKELFALLKGKTALPYAPRSEIEKLQHKIDEVDSISQRIVLAARDQVTNLLSPASLLLVNIIRTETLEYALLKQIRNAAEKYGLKTKYDVTAMCSVESKVSKGNEWRTDVRAIRDATAHCKFKIEMSATDWNIEFNNNEEGYKFCKRFSSTEFSRFFDKHTLLYKVQLHLLIVLETLPILATHLYKS